MFSSVLVANRGEIACRIFRTARDMGLRTIAVYSAADRGAAHVEMADEAICIGGARAEESYLVAENIIRAATESGAECIHPGYGFLAENAAFAEACAAAGVTFVGPPPGAIRTMGRKDEAKALMKAAGVPVLPGTGVDVSDPQALTAAAQDMGFPVMIKAVAGGGGTGMRRVDNAQALAPALEAAQREANAAFGDARVILEKCLVEPRHIEVQILADSYGACMHLFERDCSLQRRHQKIVEEAPAPNMPEGLRERITSAAVAAAKTVGYKGAGTVEFLTEEKALSDSTNFYFLEMNTRLQVEHPVTEEITGTDLVAWQFRVAAGQPLALRQEEVTLNGHAVEARLYAEDPENDFLPSSGDLHFVRWPQGEGIRVEAGVRTGDAVSPYYDPLLTKIVAHGPTRADALERMQNALRQTIVAGPRTNLAFLARLLDVEEVKLGEVDTGLVSRLPAREIRESGIDAIAARAGIEALLKEERRRIEALRSRHSNDRLSPWNAADGFRLSPLPGTTMAFLADGVPIRAEISWREGEPVVTLQDNPGNGEKADKTGGCETIVAGGRVYAFRNLRLTEVRFPEAEGAAGSENAGDGEVRAPMHGRIVELSAKAGDKVEMGETLAVLEAMKMEHRVPAPMNGVVAEISVSEGDQLAEGAAIAVIAPAEAS